MSTDTDLERAADQAIIAYFADEGIIPMRDSRGDNLVTALDTAVQAICRELVSLAETPNDEPPAPQ